jgi:hypothetical protein
VIFRGLRPAWCAVRESRALGSTHFDVPAIQKRARRNQITRKLVMSKFAIWIWCFCPIRVLGMGQFNQRGNKHYETKTIT